MAPPAGEGQSTAPIFVQLFPIFIVFILFYVALIRPQQKKAKEHAEMMKQIKPGDKILTSGGLLAVVVSVKDRSVSIRSGDSKLEVLKSAISEILEKSNSTTEA